MYRFIHLYTTVPNKRKKFHIVPSIECRIMQNGIFSILIISFLLVINKKA